MGRKSRYKLKNEPVVLFFRTDFTLGEDDKFSRLRDPFFYRIISSLPIDDFARVVTLSKNIRNRCYFSRDVEIDLRLHEEAEEVVEKKKKESRNNSFNGYGIEKKKQRCPPPKKIMYEEEEMKCFIINILDMVMNLRNKGMIKSMKIPWYRFKPNEIVRVNNWIQTAARFNVENIDMDISLEGKGQCIDFPIAKYLKVFKLNLHDSALMLPYQEFSSLEVLNLNSVEILCEFDFFKMISSCKHLNKLSLKNCVGIEKIEINSKSLEEICIMKRNLDDLQCIKVLGNKVKTIHITWYFESSKDKSFRLWAPGVQSLTWNGDSVSNCDMRKFNYLEDASINLRHSTMLIVNQKVLIGEKSMIDLVQHVRGVKKLQLNCWHLEMFIEQCDQSSSFKNLEELILNVSSMKIDRQVPAITKFLKILPNLQTLQIKNCRRPWGWGANVGKAIVLETPSCDWMSRLKYVEMELVGGGDEIELIEYLLDYATNLEKLVILYPMLDIGRSDDLYRKIKVVRFSGVVCFLPYT